MHLHHRISHRRAPVIMGTVLAALVVALTANAISAGRAQAFSFDATPAPANTAVYTFKYDTTREGWNQHETILNTSNVNTNTFGRLISYPVDGQVYAQPLFVPGVTINGHTYNVVFVATEHDSIYAFDADRTVTTPLWHTSFLGPNITTVPTNVAYPNGFTDITPEIGITGTPVIDPSTGTMYVDVMTLESNIAVHRLHALDITTGKDKMPPVVVAPTYPGKGDGNVNGVIHFDALTANERMSLLLLNGVVYVSYAGFADQYPYHGWIVGFNAQTLQQVAVWNDSPNGSGAGLWDDGNGFVVDPSDNSIYVQSGNGTFDANTGGSDYGMSLIHLSTTNGLHVLDYFTPFNQSCLNSLDRDLGSGGTILLPTQSGTHPYEVVGGGKEGRVYLLDRTNLGKFVSIANPCNNQNLTNVDNVVQEQFLGTNEGDDAIYATPAFYSGPNGQFVYEGGINDHIKAFSLTNGQLSTTPVSQSPESFNFPGENMSVSSNGTTPGTGILWVIAPGSSCPVLDHCNPSGAGTLRAYDANNISNELYSSSQNSARDGLSSFVKFTVPVVANGEVFVGTGNSLDIFGLNPPSTNPTPTPSPSPSPSPSPTPPPYPYNNIGTTDDNAPALGNFDGLNSYSAQALLASHVIPGSAVPVNNAAFLWPNAAPGTPNNWQANGQVIPVTAVSGAQTLAFLGSATSGPSSGIGTITYFDGTTQKFTLSFSDWTLNGGGGTLLPNNTTVLTMPYRNTPNGKQAENTYVYYTDVALIPGKIIQSVTLPSSTNQGRIHVFAIATTASKALTGSAPAPMNYNNVGVSDDGSMNKGNFDGVNSYSYEALQALGITPGSTIVFNGISFTWPNVPAGQQDDWQAKGQVIPVTPVSGATTVGFLGAATSGPSTAQMTLTYTDGSTQTLPLTFSDWTLGGGSNKPVAGNKIAITTPYRNDPNGRQNVTTYVFEAELPLATGKTLQSVTLPATVSQGTFHVFAIGTKGAPPAPATYNNVGITDDTATAPGNFDGLNSYSLQALQAAGVKPGATVTFNGVTFTWPSAAAGQNDNYQANGQTIPVTTVSGATTLAFLGAATSGPSSGTALITYSDGSTQPFTLSFSDWTLGAGTQTPVAGNQIAIATAYRNTQSGKDTTQTDVFYTDVALQPGKTVVSVTLPSMVSQGTLHVFAIGSKAATTSTAAVKAATRPGRWLWWVQQHHFALLPLVRRLLWAQ